MMITKQKTTDEDRNYFIHEKDLKLLRKLDQRIGLELHNKVYKRLPNGKIFKKYRVIYEGHYYTVKYINRELCFTNKVTTIKVNSAFLFTESLLSLLREKSSDYSKFKGN